MSRAFERLMTIDAEQSRKEREIAEAMRRRRIKLASSILAQAQAAIARVRSDLDACGRDMKIWRQVETRWGINDDLSVFQHHHVLDYGEPVRTAKGSFIYRVDQACPHAIRLRPDGGGDHVFTARFIVRESQRGGVVCFLKEPPPKGWTHFLVEHVSRRPDRNFPQETRLTVFARAVVGDPGELFDQFGLRSLGLDLAFGEEAETGLYRGPRVDGT